MKKEIQFLPTNAAVLTVSDSRTLETDKSGNLIVSYLEEAGHNLADRKIVKDDLETIRSTVKDWAESGNIEFIIVTGGTGVTQRDVTPEAIKPLFTKHIPGFGELFRYLSFEEIGTSTIQSRADAGLIGHTIAFLLPGSTGACRLGMERIILDQMNLTFRPCNFAELMPRIKDDSGCASH